MATIAQLEAEYCPPLDPALLFAIVSDFDLGDVDSLDTARSTLNQLKESALAEESAEFEPSGVRNDHISPAKDSSSQDRSTNTGDEQTSSITDDMSLSNDLSALSLNDSSLDYNDFDSYDDDTKMLLLIDVFGEQVSERTIRSALRDSAGKWSAAMEDLLNQVYFQDAEHSDSGERLVVKGIDGFAEERLARRTKKRRNRAQRASQAVESSADEATYSPANKWDLANEEVTFLSSRTGLEANYVRIVYNKHGASIPKTINALVKEEMTRHMQKDEPGTVVHAKELGEDFPTIATPYLLSLVRMTHPSTAHAHELAKALVARPVSSNSIHIIPQYARVTEAELKGPSLSVLPMKQSTAISTLSPESYAAAKAQAFAQASAAHRRAKSNRLMGGAAAYYGQLGRDYNDLTHAANAAAADHLVESQSTAVQVDLHGVDVLNAVRIARIKTQNWWSDLGENRANGRLGAAQRHQGFRIVVGLGTHSEGGKSKLGPAVTKMLRSEGWRISNEGAVIVVTGKQLI